MATIDLDMNMNLLMTIFLLFAMLSFAIINHNPMSSYILIGILGVHLVLFGDLFY